MRAIILIRDVPDQVALCHKITAHCEVAAVVLSQNIIRKKPSLKNRLRLFANRVGNKLVGGELSAVWYQMLETYQKQFPEPPNIPLVQVANVNDQATLDAIEKYNPDYIIVSGTNLVGRKIIEAAEKRKGVINLHTGLSPYIKGGPNCTNWCLANRDFHLIGNTVMWLDIGSDSGRIISTEQTPLVGDETLLELHLKVLEHAHDLYVRAIKKLARGEDVPSVPQSSIAEGVTFYNRDWNPFAVRRAISNFKKHYGEHFQNQEECKRKTAELKLISLER